MADRIIYRGPIFNLAKRTIRRDGRKVNYDVILHPGAVIVVPLLPRRRVAMVRQFRGSVGETLYEIVAGGLEPGESPRQAARRELIEEVGLRARRLKKLAEFYSAPGFCTELLHLYVATDLEEVDAAPEHDEFLERIDLPLSKALKLAQTGKIRDAKTIVGLQLTDHYARGRSR